MSNPIKCEPLPKKNMVRIKTKNQMENLVKLLNINLDEEFTIQYCNPERIYRISKKGLESRWINHKTWDMKPYDSEFLVALLRGDADIIPR